MRHDKHRANFPSPLFLPTPGQKVLSVNSPPTMMTHEATRLGKMGHENDDSTDSLGNDNGYLVEAFESWGDNNGQSIRLDA